MRGYPQPLTMSPDHLNYDYFTPLTGATVIILDGHNGAIIEPAGALAGLTVQLPTASAYYDGAVVKFSITQAITTLTVTATAGTVVAAGAATTAAAGQGFGYVCSGVAAKWYRLY